MSAELLTAFERFLTDRTLEPDPAGLARRTASNELGAQPARRLGRPAGTAPAAHARPLLCRFPPTDGVVEKYVPTSGQSPGLGIDDARRRMSVQLEHSLEAKAVAVPMQLQT
jgi:hypothetical protein